MNKYFKIGAYISAALIYTAVLVFVGKLGYDLVQSNLTALLKSVYGVLVISVMALIGGAIWAFIDSIVTTIKLIKIEKV